MAVHTYNPALLRKEDCKLEASRSYIAARPCLKTNQQSWRRVLLGGDTCIFVTAAGPRRLTLGVLYPKKKNVQISQI